MAHLIIYLDESGDLGLDFKTKNPSQYFVITILVCLGNDANKHVSNSVKRTLKNKLPKSTRELKGSNLTLAIKKYFLKEVRKNEDWYLHVGIANKKIWLDHHHANNSHDLKKKVLYDNLAKKVFSDLDGLENAKRVDIVIDRSKTKTDILEFNDAVKNEIMKKISPKTPITMRHAYSHEEAGLQAVDLFCIGAWRNKEKSDNEWYKEFSDRIATETEYNF